MDWYLLQTKPNAHATAYEHLKRQGFSVFLPLTTKTLTKNGKFLDYKFINVVDELKKHRLQGRYDSNSGYCITWSLLYFHYKVLNPSVSYKRLIKHIDKKINLDKLLKYAKHVEDILKSI